MNSVPEIAIEYDIFHMLAKKHRRTDVEHVFIAIQAAIAFSQKAVDVGAVAGLIMPEGRNTMDVYCPNIGPEGIAHFYFLFDIKLVQAGSSDYHDYRFTRRHDGAVIDAHLKTACEPCGPKFQRAYSAYVQKLDAERDQLVMKYEWKTTAQRFRDVFGDDIHIVSL